MNVQTIDEIKHGERRNCDQCPLSRLAGQASCKYRNEPDNGSMPGIHFGEKKKAVPCLKFYIQAGLHGWIDPISGEPIIITAQAAKAIQAALDEQNQE